MYQRPATEGDVLEVVGDIRDGDRKAEALRPVDKEYV
jgi:hypothetical protein